MLDPHKTLVWAREQRQRTDLPTVALQLADAVILACEQLIAMAPQPDIQPDISKPPEPILP